MLKEIIKNKKTIKNLPLELQDFLVDLKTIEKLNKIIEDLAFSKKQEIALLDLFLDVVFGRVELYNLLANIPEKLNISMDDAMELADRMYQDFFIALENVLNAQHAAYHASNPEVPKLVNKNDKDNKQNRKEEWDLLINNAIKKLNINFSNSRVKERFYTSTLSYLDSARTEAQYKEALQRGEKAGGVGMSDKSINSLVSFLSKYVAIKDKEKKEKKEAEVPNDSKLKEFDIKDKGREGIKVDVPKEQKEKLIKAPILNKNEVDFKEEDQEVKKEEKKLAKTIALIDEDIKKNLKKPFSKKEEKDNLPKKEKQLKLEVKDILDHLKINFPSKDLNSRFKLLIESILRDVRTSGQVLERLTLDINKGGFGMNDVDAEKLRDKINAVVNERADADYLAKLKEIKDEDKKSRKNTLEKMRKQRVKAQQELDDRFNKLSNGKTVKKSIYSKANSKLKEKTKISLEEEKPYFDIPRTISGKPIVEDIKFKSKLYGPIEEIGRITLDDFRKLSNDPKEALLKIKDKLNLLREESFLKYEKGKDAWLHSSLYSDYLDIIDRALNEKSKISQVLANSKTLTEQEFNAIMEAGLVD